MYFICVFILRCDTLYTACACNKTDKINISNIVHITFIHFCLVDRICATSRSDSQCEQLLRGNTEVNCQRVQDSIECAHRIRNATADFGIFSAESALQLASLEWSDLTVVKELRHRDRLNGLYNLVSELSLVI